MILCGDALTELRKPEDESVHCCVTSPPYFGLRDYGIPSQLGLEPTPEAYVAKLVEIFREVRRILRKDGTLWLVIGDSYAGSCCGANDYRKEGSSISKNDNKYRGQRPGLPSGLKPKDLVGIPWRIAFALQADGWYLRSDIIWSKPNPMPESVMDRPTKSHEYIFLLSKSAKYYWDQEAVRELVKKSCNGTVRAQNRHADNPREMNERKYDEIKGANIKSVWTITTKPFKEAHFATFPPEIPERCIKAGCPVGGMVLDPFLGAGTTGLVALRLGRDFIGIDLNPKYCEMAKRRIYGELEKA